MASCNVIIGQEVIYSLGSSYKYLGRVASYSAWEGKLEKIWVKPYIGNESIMLEPDQVIELIDPRSSS